ncbi:hypothetical protein ZIOFF_023135 [Zingiber officinale]|uniref:Tetratricopeptide repeat protein n=1 Tax=Zingiber officinale TaxID=94328 RepID=A0A8J5H677_ZINOF|nr:hypothetical protein ZIOFF_023135 [Zingiber officinale]
MDNFAANYALKRVYYVNYALGYLDAGNLAGIYYEQSQLDMAILHYKQAINCDSTFIEAYNNLTAADGLVNRGNTLKEIGRVTEAIQDYIRAVNIIPTMPKANANLASAYKDRDASVQPGWGLEPGYLATTAFIGAAQCLGRLFRVVCSVIGRDGDWETTNVGGTIGIELWSSSGGVQEIASA